MEPERNDPERNETHAEKLDRNWNELLQELRVTQTGVQILSGFLLTLPFQSRFPELTRDQIVLYLITTGLSVVATGLLVAPVSAHRLLFRQREKDALVSEGNALAQAGLAVLGLTVVATLALIFSVVLDTRAAVVAGASALVFFVVIWLVLPFLVRRKR